MDDQLVDRLLLDVDAERADGVQRGFGVARAPERAHARVAFRERTDEQRAVRDRLVAWDCDVPDERPGRLDLHASSTDAITTW